MNVIKPKNCSTVENLNCSIHLQHDYHALPSAFLSIQIVGILVLLVNGGVFVILIKDKDIRKNPYLFLVLMLCVSDFTVGLGIPNIGIMFFIPSLNGNKILTVLQVVLMTSGLCLSLLQTFLISLQRYLVLVKENWNLYIFQQNRKYYVCVGSSIVVVIPNFVHVSPSPRKFNPYNERILSYLYHGHYLAHSILYIRFLSLSLLTLTLIFYSVTVRHVLKTYKKVSPVGNSNSTHVRTIHVHMTQASATVCDTNTTIIENGRGKSHSHFHRQVLSMRQKKVVSTLKLVGILIILLIILTGPFIFSLWNANTSAESNILVTCLCLFNSFVNPFIYLWRLYDVRRFIKSKLCFGRY